jgi:hypothetical protein
MVAPAFSGQKIGSCEPDRSETRSYTFEAPPTSPDSAAVLIHHGLAGLTVKRLLKLRHI